MSQTTLLTIFVAFTAVGVIVQMGILFALYKAMEKSSARMEKIAGQLEERALPILDSTRTILQDAEPKISEITTNLAEVTALVRYRVEHVSEATGEIVERARLQAARIDAMIASTADKVEQTTDLLQASVLAPVRRVHAIIQAIVAGINVFRRGRPPAQPRPASQEEDEEMFI